MNVLKTMNEIESALNWEITKPEQKPVAKKTRLTKVEIRKQILKLLEQGPAVSVEIAEKLGIKPKTINSHTRPLERLGCIKSATYGWNFKQFHFVTYDNCDKEPLYYEPRKMRIKQNALPELPFDPVLSRMMGYTDKLVADGRIYANLDKASPKGDLRKMNYAWMGYQSGTESAL